MIEMEANLVAVARIRQYSDIDLEVPRRLWLSIQKLVTYR